MQLCGPVQTLSSSIDAGQCDCVHQQTSHWQLIWNKAEEGEGTSAQCLLLFAAAGLLWFFGS